MNTWAHNILYSARPDVDGRLGRARGSARIILIGTPLMLRRSVRFGTKADMAPEYQLGQI
jgi:hypothetical protein